MIQFLFIDRGLQWGKLNYKVHYDRLLHTNRNDSIEYNGTFTIQPSSR